MEEQGVLTVEGSGVFYYPTTKSLRKQMPQMSAIEPVSLQIIAHVDCETVVHVFIGNSFECVTAIHEYDQLGTQQWCGRY